MGAEKTAFERGGDRGDEVGSELRFHHEAKPAAGERGAGKIVVLVNGKVNHADPRAGINKFLDSVKSAKARHRNVDDRELRLVLAHRTHKLDAVSDDIDHVEISFDQRDDRLPHRSVVVGYDNPRAAGAFIGCTHIGGGRSDRPPIDCR